MNLDEKMFDKILKTISSRKQITLLTKLKNDPAPTYSQLRALFEETYGSKRIASGLFAHYLRKLLLNGLVKVDEKRYFLTRVGLQIITLLENIQNICMKYDLADCDADGKIIMFVERK